MLFGTNIHAFGVIALITLILLFAYLMPKSAVVEPIVRKADYLLVRYLFVFCIVGLVTKFLLLGVPLFAEDANIERVHFARTYRSVSDILKFTAYLCIVYFAINMRYRTAVLFCFGLAICGGLAGFRSQVVEPFVFLALAIYLSDTNLSLTRLFSRHGLKLTFVAAGFFGVLSIITWYRFGSKVGGIQELALFLVRRIFYVNYANVITVERIFDGDPLFGASFLWDFQSLFSDDLGFSGKVTQLSGFRDYLLLRMTPTIIGEGLANFGSGYWVVYVALITGILAALWWLYCSCKERCMPILATIILFLVIAFCRYSVPHGIGSFFFSYFIKIVLSGMVMKAFTWTLSPVLISHR